MLISIWGRDGSGKSTLADHLGERLSKKSHAAVIDTGRIKVASFILTILMILMFMIPLILLIIKNLQSVGF